MYICLCQGVNEETVRRVIADGASDPDTVSQYSGAGTGCGGCYPELCRLLEESRLEAAACSGDVRHDAA